MHEKHEVVVNGRIYAVEQGAVPAPQPGQVRADGSGPSRSRASRSAKAPRGGDVAARWFGGGARRARVELDSDWVLRRLLDISDKCMQAKAVMEWARDVHGVQHFAASVSPDNPPSLRIVQRLGFAKVGEEMDEIDGIEYVFLRAAH